MASYALFGIQAMEEWLLNWSLYKAASVMFVFLLCFLLVDIGHFHYLQKYYEEGLEIPMSFFMKYVLRKKKYVPYSSVDYIERTYIASVLEDKISFDETTILKVHTKTDLEFCLNSPSVFSNNSILPILKSVFQNRWDEVYKRNFDSSLFSQREVNDIRRKREMIKYEYAGYLMSKLLLHFWMYEAKGTPLHEALVPIKAIAISLLEKHYGKPLSELKKMPLNKSLSHIVRAGRIKFFPKDD